MGVRNYLIEGVSATGKSGVCKELKRRGCHAINGDTELAYRGDPATGKPTDGFGHEHHIWQVAKVRAIVANQAEAVTFFCGGSRNFSRFIDLFDGVFVLEVDRDTLERRLDERAEDEWGGRQAERELILRLHQTGEDVPTNGIVIDATASITRVVDAILRQTEQNRVAVNLREQAERPPASAPCAHAESGRGLDPTIDVGLLRFALGRPDRV